MDKQQYTVERSKVTSLTFIEADDHINFWIMVGSYAVILRGYSRSTGDISAAYAGFFNFMNMI